MAAGRKVVCEIRNAQPPRKGSPNASAIKRCRGDRGGEGEKEFSGGGKPRRPRGELLLLFVNLPDGEDTGRVVDKIFHYPGRLSPPRFSQLGYDIFRTGPFPPLRERGPPC